MKSTNSCARILYQNQTVTTLARIIYACNRPLSIGARKQIAAGPYKIGAFDRPPAHLNSIRIESSVQDRLAIEARREVEEALQAFL